MLNSVTSGKANSRLYNTWRGMKSRCLNPNATNYENYGGRGISLCEEWMQADVFIKWALSSGYQDGLSIERKNNDGNYSPENCRWATKLEQNNNRRSSSLVSFDGETRSISEWARAVGINRQTLKSRLAHGWPIDKALYIPSGAIRPGPKPKK